MKVGDVLLCRTGTVLKRAKGQRAYPLLSAKYIDDLGQITGTETFYGKEIAEGDRLKEGDLVMKIAAPNTAVYIQKEWEGTVVSSFYFHLRSLDGRLDPRFLAVYFNSSLFRKELEKALVFSTVKALKISTLKKMEIPEVPEERQREMIALAEAMRREEVQRRKFCEVQKQYYRQVISDLLRESQVV